MVHSDGASGKGSSSTSRIACNSTCRLSGTVIIKLREDEVNPVS